MSNSESNQIESAVAAGVAVAQIEGRTLEIQDPDRRGRPVVVGLVATEHGPTIRVLDDVAKAFDASAPGPRHRTGTVKLTDEASFIAFAARWGGEHTVIYADTAALAFAAVLDDHPADDNPDNTRWRQHRASYACPRSNEWMVWATMDGRAMSQTDFGDFLESRLEDMRQEAGMPTPLEVLGVARKLHIRTKGEFRREVNPTNGDHVLVNKSETDTDSTVIPRAFLIAIPVFDGGGLYQIEARVRLAFESGAPRFSFTLHRRKEIERDAFNEVRARVAKETGRVVLAGTP